MNEQYFPNFALFFVSMNWSKCFFNIAGWTEANQWFPCGRTWGRGVGSELHHFRPDTEKAVLQAEISDADPQLVEVVTAPLKLMNL